jgi:hypothetical protein
MQSASHYPQIIGVVADLFFVSKIETTSKLLGFEVVWLSDASLEILSPPLEGVDTDLDYKNRPETILIESVSSYNPVLIIFDLNNQTVPWSQWILWLKSSPATRMIPILCFCSHVDKMAILSARNSGADKVVARSEFANNLSDLINSNARIVDFPAIYAACQESLSPQAVRGLELFNQGEYFEAHELLEIAWNEDRTAGRMLYQAILQVSVAYLQIERENYRGAIKMFQRLRKWLDPLPDACRGVDINRLRSNVNDAYQALLTTGSQGIKDFDRKLLREIPIQYSD